MTDRAHGRHERHRQVGADRAHDRRRPHPGPGRDLAAADHQTGGGSFDRRQRAVHEVEGRHDLLDLGQAQAANVAEALHGMALAPICVHHALLIQRMQRQLRPVHRKGLDRPPHRGQELVRVLHRADPLSRRSLPSFDGLTSSRRKQVPARPADLALLPLLNLGPRGNVIRGPAGLVELLIGERTAHRRASCTSRRVPNALPSAMF
ncbi:hypothetical protein [Dactylosporangium sp. CA-139066]|uniref:hypothetical protein n=1 Tax=Dactylosporangium sp. CA-139066 TaxID=3239930 RepID=UPI003D92E187